MRVLGHLLLAVRDPAVFNLYDQLPPDSTLWSDCGRFWQLLDAKNPSKGYGSLVAGKAWHWYEHWVDVVRNHCHENKENYS